ncbi:type 1 fimbrial protein [Enterobacteriaceae bacterium 89]|nr:type 1 fimbrial protein [Enterobacteriaceae bacterium 89]
MKSNAIIGATLVSLSMLSGLAHADATKDEGHGKVHFAGSIIDAPCSIDTKSADQVVLLGQVADKVLASQGKSQPTDFHITLTGCELGTMKSVQVTFNGTADTENNALLAIAGTASGAGIGLNDEAGNAITLGTATDAKDLVDGDNTLNFSAYLQGDSDTAAVVPGEFTSVADFTLQYN